MGSVHPKRTQKRRCHGTLIGRRGARSLEQECHSQRVGLRRRKLVEHVTQPRAKQITYAREPEPRLSGGGSCLQRLKANRSGGIYTCLPESGLAYSGIPHENETYRTMPQRLEETVECAELFVTADDVALGR